MLRRLALVRTDVPKELSASIVRVTRIGELGTLAVTSNRCTLWRNTAACFSCWLLLMLFLVHRFLSMMEAKRSSEMSVLTTATWHNIPEDGNLHSHCCENFKSYITGFCFNIWTQDLPETQKNKTWIFTPAKTSNLHYVIFSIFLLQPFPCISLSANRNKWSSVMNYWWIWFINIHRYVYGLQTQLLQNLMHQSELKPKY
jgi:hypothetical protein